MSQGDTTDSLSNKPDLQTLYRPLAIRAVAAAALMAKREVCTKTHPKTNFHPLGEPL